MRIIYQIVETERGQVMRELDSELDAEAAMEQVTSKYKALKFTIRKVWTYAKPAPADLL